MVVGNVWEALDNGEDETVSCSGADGAYSPARELRTIRYPYRLLRNAHMTRSVSPGASTQRFQYSPVTNQHKKDVIFL